MDKSLIEIAIGQTNILIEDEVCKAVGKVGIHINKAELLKALKAYEFVEELTNYIFEYPDDDYMTMECLCRKLVKHGLLDKTDGYYHKTEPQTEASAQEYEKWLFKEPQTEEWYTWQDEQEYNDRWQTDPQTERSE